MAKNKFNAPGIQKLFDASKASCFSPSTVASEKRKTFRIENRTGLVITKIKIDGCLISSQQNKCDFAFVIENNQEIMFIELKSEDINHAYVQIVKTIEFFKNTIDLDKGQIEGYIVSSSVPRQANLKFQSLVAKFKKDYGKNLLKHTNQCTKQI